MSIDSQRIGGPSAGLAFTLGLLDELTPGDLTGGKEVAATGTISPDGTVGEIGGVEQKVTAVHRAHIPYFMVPAEDAPAAQKNAPSDVRSFRSTRSTTRSTFLARSAAAVCPHRRADVEPRRTSHAESAMLLRRGPTIEGDVFF